MGLMIKNGTVVTASDRYVADIWCENGIIRAIGTNLEIPTGGEVIDATGRFVLPGLIDPHVHLEMPFMGTVSADDWFTGTAAALAGGTTTVIDFVMPARNQSLLAARDAWAERAKKACCDYGFHVGLTWYSEQVKREMTELFHGDGIQSFKVFLAYRGAIGVDDVELVGVLDAAREIGALISGHCEHGDAIVALQKRMLEQGKTEPKYHALSRPSFLEGEATERFVALARATGAARNGHTAEPEDAMPVYVVHLTCREAMEAVMRARAAGQQVYVETCPQYLLLDDSVYDKPDFEGAAYVMSPPIRPLGHQEFLWNALRSGQIDTIGTDHCPFRQADQKIRGKGDFTKIPNGAAGIENRLQLMYTYGVAAGRITLEQLVEVCATRPAQIFGLGGRKGSIVLGGDADLVVYDPQGTAAISAKTHHQAVDRNIFEGFEVKGRVAATVLRGEVRFRDGELHVKPGHGRYIRRTPAPQTARRAEPALVG